MNKIAEKDAILRWLALLLWLLVPANYAYALPVTGLYSQEIAVNNESNAERSRAFKEALAAVVIKVTGDERWLDDPAIVRALAVAESYVQEIRYRSEMLTIDSEPAPEEGNPPAGNSDVDVPVGTSTNEPLNGEIPLPPLQQQNYILVNFAPDLIDELLSSAEIPVWDSNRPSVMLWMVLQNDSGERRLLSRETHPEMVAVIDEFAQRRGLPIIYPLLDFEDLRNLTVDDLWALDEESITTASSRYAADTVLSGRLHITATGELVGLWKFFFQDSTETFDGVESDIAIYLQQPLAKITSQLSSYFAFVRTAAEQQVVRLRIEGVDDLRAYSGVLAYLRSLGLVEEVAPSLVLGKTIELDVSLLGNRQQLYELIALDRDLLPIESTMTDSLALLHYRWTR